jgi:hypothetical protein
MSTNKLCIYTDYMVAFGNSVWMYYIEKLNIYNFIMKFLSLNEFSEYLNQKQNSRN